MTLFVGGTVVVLVVVGGGVVFLVVVGGGVVILVVADVAAKVVVVVVVVGAVFVVFDAHELREIRSSPMRITDEIRARILFILLSLCWT